MTVKIACSVPILTLNCKPALERLLPIIVPEIEDVFILDGNSTDGTVEYARSMGVRIEKQFDNDIPNQRIQDFHAMRMRLWSKARKPWLLILDADEQPTPELLARTREIVAANDPMVAHRFVRRVKLPDGRVVQHAFFYPDIYIRVFNLLTGITLAKRKIHERFVLPPGVREQDHVEALLTPWDPPEVFRDKQYRYIAIEQKDAQPTWSYLLRWIVIYNFRSLLGQSMRALRAWFQARRRQEVVLPWAYTRVLLWYRIKTVGTGIRLWREKRRTTAIVG